MSNPITFAPITFASTLIAAVASLLRSPAAEDPQTAPDEREYLAERLLGQLLAALITSDALEVLRVTVEWQAVNARVMSENRPGYPEHTFRCEVAHLFARLGTTAISFRDGSSVPTGSDIGEGLLAALTAYRG